MRWPAPAYGIVAGSTNRPGVTYELLFGPIVWSTVYLLLPPTGNL